MEQLKGQYPHYQLLDEYLGLPGSTTAFINAYAKHNVKVGLVRQCVRANYLYRKSLLYLTNIERPVLLASGIFYLQNIPKEFIDQIIDGRLLIGEIFGCEFLSKKNHTVNRVHNVQDMNLLSSSGDECYKRRFSLAWNGQIVGLLSEVVSAETLDRILE